MQNRKEILEWIRSLEDRYPVGDWKAGGVRIWPMLRRQIFNTAVKSIDRIGVEQKGSDRRTYFYIIRDFLTSMKALSWMLVSRRCTYLFSGKFSHRVCYNGEFYNRYFDPLMDYVESKGKKALIVEYDREQIDKKYYRGDRILFLKDYVFLFRVLARLFNRDIKLDLIGYDSFLEEIMKNTLLIGKMGMFARCGVLRNAKSILLFARVYGWIIKTTGSKVSFGLCYYNNEMFGMNIGAYNSRCITVDMQHGGQGPLHFAYSFWKLPVGGYEMLPDIFWVWDNLSAKSIRFWHSSDNVDSVVVGGNPWLKWLLQRPVSRKLPQNIVLYTMQPIGDLLDDYLIEAIRLTKERYRWWLRLHPRQISERDRLIYLLKCEGLLDEVDIDDASTLPLPTILTSSLVHISKFSGSINESIALGIPTIVIDSIGAATYESYIQSGQIFVQLERSSDNLVQQIDQLAGFRAERQCIDYEFFIDKIDELI